MTVNAKGVKKIKMWTKFVTRENHSIGFDRYDKQIIELKT